MKSNGWSPDTAALQLFAHLEGEALKVVLLMPDRIRERWKDLVDELSAYYNTPGLDLATFATELGILALRGFSNMKEKARDLMVRNKFIVAQQSCDLRRHLDGAAPEASIVDSCRIWESHAEPIAIDNWWQDPVYRRVTFSAVAEVHVSASAIEDAWGSSRDIECPRGGCAHHQADEAFGSDDRPGRHTYGGDSGSGHISGQ